MIIANYDRGFDVFYYSLFVLACVCLCMFFLFCGCCCVRVCLCVAVVVGVDQIQHPSQRCPCISGRQRPRVVSGRHSDRESNAVRFFFLCCCCCCCCCVCVCVCERDSHFLFLCLFYSHLFGRKKERECLEIHVSCSLYFWISRHFRLTMHPFHTCTYTTYIHTYIHIQTTHTRLPLQVQNIHCGWWTSGHHSHVEFGSLDPFRHHTVFFIFNQRYIEREREREGESGGKKNPTMLRHIRLLWLLLLIMNVLLSSQLLPHHETVAVFHFSDCV
jgi:hypothetical protein